MEPILVREPRAGNIIRRITGHVPPDETQKTQISSPFDTYLAWREWPADQHAECYEWSTFNDHDAAEGDEEGRS